MATVIYACKFSYYGKEITITKAVTDNMEERPGWKPSYAKNWMRQAIVTHTAWQGDRKLIWRTEEISPSQRIPLKKTLADMDKAKADWRKEHDFKE